MSGVAGVVDERLHGLFHFVCFLSSISHLNRWLKRTLGVTPGKSAAFDPKVLARERTS